jgi:hypothetical protein
MQNIFVSLLLATCLSACQSKQVEADMTNCAKLKVGMSREEVITIMGRPAAENPATDNLGTFLYYSEPHLASGPITIHLASSSVGYRVDYAECKGQE